MQAMEKNVASALDNVRQDVGKLGAQRWQI